MSKDKDKDDASATTQIEEYLRRLGDEEVLTLYCNTCDKLRTLKDEYVRDAVPARDLLLQAKATLIKWMKSNGTDCLKIPEAGAADPDAAWYVRLVTKQSVHELLTPRMLKKALDDLHTPEVFQRFLHDMEREREDRKAKWLAKQEELITKQLKAEKTERGLGGGVYGGGGAGVGAAAGAEALVKKRRRVGSSADVVVSAEEVRARLPEHMPIPGPRMHGLYPQRPLLPADLPLTRAQVLAQVLYDGIKARHKQPSETLEIKEKPGRARAVLEAAGPVAARAQLFRTNKQTYTQVFSSLKATARRHKAVLARCEPRMRPYLSALDPDRREVKRTFACADGNRCVTITDKVKPVLQKPLSLWETSQLVDESVKAVRAAVPASFSLDAAFNPETDIPRLTHMIDVVQGTLLDRADALLRKRTTETPMVVMRRSRVLKDGERGDPGPDPDDPDLENGDVFGDGEDRGDGEEGDGDGDGGLEFD